MGLGVPDCAKFAVMVPGPFMVAFVDAREAVSKAMAALFAVHDSKLYPEFAAAAMSTFDPELYQMGSAVAAGAVMAPPTVGLTVNLTAYCF